MNTRDQVELMDKIYKVNKMRYEGQLKDETGKNFMEAFSAELVNQLRETEKNG